MFGFDEELIDGVINNDKDCYNTFYLETVDVFYRFLQSHYFLSSQEIEDLLSDFYLKFWRVGKQYNPEYKFESFVWTVFKNLVKDYFKRSKEHFVDEQVMQSYDDQIVDHKMKEHLEAEFELEQIKEAMSTLDMGSQELLFLKYIEGQSYDQIEWLLGISQTTLRKRVSRALWKLRNNLEGL